MFPDQAPITLTQGKKTAGSQTPTPAGYSQTSRRRLKRGRGQGKRKGVSIASAQGLGAPVGTAKVTEVTAAGKLFQVRFIEPQEEEVFPCPIFLAASRSPSSASSTAP